jgi:ATP-dependent RNA helicase DDX27
MNTIPPALKGRDICASAITGSGKTAAFILPILERLLYRNTSMRCTRVLILMPTRELAVQCHSVITNLSKYTNGISAALVTGGMSSKKQEAELRQIPDIIVATPGRVLDHVLNTRGVDLGDIEILVLDEADRLLELGFMEQLEQVVKSCPVSRQTMLFSATMTDKVDELASLSLKNPARLSVDPMFQVARKLVQEFVRVRSGTERDKEALLLSLCTRTFTTKTIIFCTRKHTAHRLKIIFSLAELNAVELHGDLTQEQRFDSLESFRDGKADFLIASDVASRGLDVIGVDTVINFELPLHLSSYVHRVGRTARAGRSGRAVSLVTEADRRLFKMIVKNSHDTVKQRIVPPKSLLSMREKIDSMQETIQKVLAEETEDKLLRLAEMEANRTSNLIEHRDEIMSRPKKTWFQNEQQKKAMREESKRVHLGEAKFKIEGDETPKSKKQLKKEAKEEQANEKKRKRDEVETSRQYNIYTQSNSAKKRKVSDEDRKELKAQHALMRQRKREKLGRDAPATTSSSSMLSTGSKKTHIKVKNKNAHKKSTASSSSSKKEHRDKGKSLFGAEVRTASFGKKKGGFKSKSRHKRR